MDILKVYRRGRIIHGIVAFYTILVASWIINQWLYGKNNRMSPWRHRGRHRVPPELHLPPLLLTPPLPPGGGPRRRRWSGASGRRSWPPWMLGQRWPDRRQLVTRAAPLVGMVAEVPPGGAMTGGGSPGPSWLVLETLDLTIWGSYVASLVQHLDMQELQA